MNALDILTLIALLTTTLTTLYFWRRARRTDFALGRLWDRFQFVQEVYHKALNSLIDDMRERGDNVELTLVAQDSLGQNHIVYMYLPKHMREHLEKLKQMAQQGEEVPEQFAEYLKEMQDNLGDDDGQPE